MNAAWETLTVDGSEIETYLALPDDPGPAPGVVVAHYAGGVDAFIRGIVERFAGDGLAAICPNLFHRAPESDEPGITRMTNLPVAQFLRDMAAARAHLASKAPVHGRGIGVTGIGIGGPVAYLTAAGDAAFQAAVLFYPGHMAESWGEEPAPMAGTSSLTQPLLGLFGDEDDDPTPAQVRELHGELTRHGVPHEFVSYPGAGHGFMSQGRPIYRPQAAEDAWEKTVAWFTRHLA